MVNNYSDFLIFVDESGDHSLLSINKDYPIFVLCFCIIRKDIYFSQFIPKIKSLKIETFGHDLVILHEHNIRKKKGEFSQFNKLAREEFLEGLNEIIRALQFTVISIIIDKNKHQTKYLDPCHVYHLAMQFGLERIHGFMELEKQNERISHLIFEARGRNEDNKLELAFRQICNGDGLIRGYLINRIRPFQIIIADKRTNSEGLQLADLLARPIGLHYLHPNQKNRAYEILEEKFFKSNTDCIWGNGLKVFPT